MVIQHLVTTNDNFEQQFADLLQWDMHTDSALDQQVAEIISQVRKRGDAAVLELTNKLDRRDLAQPQDFKFGNDAPLQARER